MEREPLISVIIPIYNVEKWLRECIESLMNQNYGRFEAILVDDGSTDGSGALCDQYAAQDSRIKVIHQPNAGQSAARNRALDVAAGEYIAFIDADDLVPKDYLGKLLQAVIDTDADVAATGYVTWDDGKPVPQVDTVYAVKIVSPEDFIASSLYQNGRIPAANVSPCGKLWRASLWRDVRFREGIIYEDLELIPQVVEQAKTVAAIDKPMYLYRMRPGSTLGYFDSRRFAAIDVGERLVAHFAANPKLERAATDRQLSAAFNMLLLMGRYNSIDRQMQKRCCDIIKRYRGESLRDPDVRLRNKVGTALSYVIGTKTFSTRFMGRLFLRR